MGRRYDSAVPPLQTEAAPRSVCAHCAAPPPPPNRAVAVVGGVLRALAVVVVGVALVRSQRWHSGSAPKTTVPETRSTKPPSTVPSLEAAAVYLKVADPMYANRRGFMLWLGGDARSTPQYQVNERVNQYVAGAQAELDQ